MGIPLAVSAATKTPGMYLTVNLLAGTSNPGSAKLKALIIGPKSSSGTITADTMLKQAVTPDDVKTYSGPGTQAHLAAKQLFGQHGLALVDYIAPAVGGGVAASGTFTFSGAPSSTTTVKCTIHGYVVASFIWAVGESVTTIAARARDNINGQTDNVGVVATASAGVLTLTAKYAGPWGNDIIVLVELLDGAGGVMTPSTATALTSGTVEPDFTTALSTVSTREYDIIVLCTSNADGQSASGTSNPGRVKTHINTYNTGLNAKLQEVVVGLTGAISSAKTGSIARNEPAMQYVFCLNGAELPCQYAGYEAGSRLKREEADPAPNRIGTTYTTLSGALDKVANKPSDVNVEDALNNGLSILNYDGQGNLFLVAPITTHSQDTLTNPDYRTFWVSDVSGAYAVAKDLRVNLPLEFFQVKVSKDLAPGSDPLPPGVVEEKDIKAFIIGRLRFWVRAGVVDGAKLTTAISTGTLIVQVDVSDSSQVDIVIPLNIMKPLSKFSTVVQKLAS